MPLSGWRLVNGYPVSRGAERGQRLGKARLGAQRRIVDLGDLGWSQPLCPEVGPNSHGYCKVTGAGSRAFDAKSV